MSERRFVVLYNAGPNSGCRAFFASDPEQAVDRAREWVGRFVTPMHEATCEVVDENEVENE